MMHNRFVKGFLLFCICLITLSLRAQEPALIHFDVNKGLPSNEIYDLFQDKKGFLWLGTESGIVRYDGNRFMLLKSPGLRGTSVTNIREDHSGRIWFNNFSGQILFANGDSVAIFKPWEKFYKKFLVEYTFDDSNNLFVSNDVNYIYRFDLAGGSVQKLTDSIWNKQAISRMHDGSILFTLMDKVQLYTLKDNKTELVKFIGKDGKITYRSPLHNQYLFYPSFAHKQTLVIQRRNQQDKAPTLFYYEKGSIYEHPASSILRQMNFYPLSVYDDDDGNLFVGTEMGLLWIKKSESGYHLQKYFLENQVISSIIKTREGGYWISTLKGGVFQIPNLNVWSIKGTALGLKTEGVAHLAIVKNERLMGASLSGEIFEFQKFKDKPATKFPMGFQADVQALEYNPYNDKLFVSKIITELHQLEARTYSEYKFSASAKDFHFRKDGVIFSSGNQANASVRMDQKDLLMKLVDEFSIDTAAVKLSSSGPYITVPLIIQRNKCICYQESEQRLWVGLVDGLQSHCQKKWIRHTDPETHLPIIASDLLELNDGILCVATIDQGIYFIRNGQIIKHLDMRSGLLNNKIRKLATNQRDLWMTMPNAVQGFHIKENRFTKFIVTNDVEKQEIYDIEIWKDTVYLATSNGIQFFPASIYTFNRTAPFVSITNFMANGKNYTKDQEIELPYNSNNISITLLGSALRSAGKFLYQYRLLGSDTGWISNAASENVIRYATLPPGKYIFQARVINEDGIQSLDTPVLHFTIRQIWWKNWWFLLLLLFFLFGLSYLIFNSRLNNIKKKNQAKLDKVLLLEQMRNSQLIALKAQMNPHFIFNTLNSIQEIILMNDKKQANLYLGKFADLMRIILEQSNKDTISLDDEIKSLQLYLELEALRFESNFQYQLNVEGLLNTYQIQIPVMLIQPYVENAIKHGLLHKHGLKKLELNFSLKDEHTLLCIIRDNGIGRKRSGEINRMREKKHASFATSATERRLELLNNNKALSITVNIIDLVDTFGMSAGTEVILYIPLSV